MKKYLLGLATTVAAFAIAPAANAATFTPGDPGFTVSFGTDGSISATIGNSGIAGAFDDTFSFLLLTNGLGSGSVSTSFSSAVNSLIIQSVTVNDTITIPVTTNGAGFTGAAAGNIPLFAGQNSIRIRGIAGTNASYGGNITFVPNAVPEPATWAMMLVGFGMVGSAMRYRRRSTKVVYA
jgi:hypothetical protein